MSPNTPRSSTEALLRARIAVDQVRISRLATQNAIERGRESFSEIRAALVALRDAHSSAARQKVQQRIDALRLRKIS